ncbi:MAG: hypothetical protein HGA85_07550, partial [Nanoarchaeota archaeon]|nr:hypothetical protein [Nanoarchaeota archaeon]
IGKPWALNYAYRQTHQDNERDERSYLIGKLYREGEVSRIESALALLGESLQSPLAFEQNVARFFSEESSDYIQVLAKSQDFRDLVELANSYASLQKIRTKTTDTLEKYLQHHGPRFFYDVKTHDGKSDYSVMSQREFLVQIMAEVENVPLPELSVYSQKREEVLARTRPMLTKKMRETHDFDELYQITKQFNAKWAIVYDADADAPRDVMRYYAARILTDQTAMAFQGPVAPVGNLEDVTTTPRMSGYHLAFNHATLYPRMLMNKRWAHPLAGTNWCLKMDSFEDGGKPLVNNAPYDEAKRIFLAYFRPETLTEDLELGLRLFEKYNINAEWHPFVEVEQVPPDDERERDQKIRWAEGTVALIGEIWNSKVPFDQKLYFSSYPLKILATATIPVIGGLYLLGNFLGMIQFDQIYGNLPAALALSNVLYSLEFALPYINTRKYIKANYPYDEIFDKLSSLTDKADTKRYTPNELAHLADITHQIKRGLGKNGFLSRYLSIRTTDEDFDPTAAGTYDLASLAEKTAMVPTRDEFSGLVSGLEDLITTNAASYGLTFKKDRIWNGRARVNPTPLIDAEPEVTSIIGRTEHVLSLDHDNLGTKIKRLIEASLDALPYIYTQMIPPTIAIYRKLTGKQTIIWNKTERTKKKAI